MTRITFLVFLALLGWSGVLPAQPTASVTGRVVLDGQAPPPRKLDPGRDSCCQEAEPVDQSLLVGEQGGIANVVVWVVSRDAISVPSVPEAEPLELTNKGCAFEPRVLLLRTGGRLTLTNGDPTTHNVGATFRRNPSFNVVLAPEDRRELLFDNPEPKPAPVACNIHPFMRAWVFVHSDEFAAVTDLQGRFVLPAGLPEGEYRLQFWHEGRYLSGLETTLGKTDRRGRVELAVGSEPTDLGEISVPAAWFSPSTPQ